MVCIEIPLLNDSSISFLRERVEEQALIFFRDENDSHGWYKISQCLWSNTAKVRGRVTIKDLYDDDLETFFVDVLGVKSLTLQMIYDELIEPNAGRTVEEAELAILSLNTFLEAEEEEQASLPDPQILLKSPVFPVLDQRGEPSLQSAADADFAIVDREYLAVRFAGKIKTLSFKLKDIRILEPFLEWCGLGNRYLSRCVKEYTSTSSGGVSRPITVPNYDLKRKAHAILRYVVHRYTVVFFLVFFSRKVINPCLVLL
jgi:hypothetical protein